MKKVKVSARAIMARIQRKLNKDGEVLKKCSQRSQWYHSLGDYYLINDRDFIIAHGIDLEKLAEEMGSIKPYEEIEY